MIMGVSWEYDMYDGHGSRIEYGGNKILVGGILTPLKNMSSSVGMIIPIYYGQIKAMSSCSKPPTSIYI